MLTSFRTGERDHQRKTVFVVDVSVNWATNRNWQTKVLGAWKASQLNLLNLKSVKDDRVNNNNNNSNNNNNRIQRRYSRFFTISSQRRELSPTRTLQWPGRSRVQITCNTSNAYHVQVSCYVPLGTKGQLSY